MLEVLSRVCTGGSHSATLSLEGLQALLNVMPVTIERTEKTSGVQVSNKAWPASDEGVYCIYKQVRIRSKKHISRIHTYICVIIYFVKFMAKVAYLSPSK